MVFNPTSPIRVFARKEVVVERTPPARSIENPNNDSDMSSSNAPRSSSPSSNWRARFMRQSPNSEPATKEVSRWSKTTTESELSEVPPDPSSKRRSFLKKKINQRRLSKDTAKSSPTDPFYDPVTRTLQPQYGDVPRLIKTRGADDDEGGQHPQTFLDDPSDDEADSPTSPVIQRASSVRVGRPQVVQHSNSSAGSVPKLYAPQNTPSSGHEAPPSSSLNQSQTLGEDLNTAMEKREYTADEVPGGPTDALRALEGEIPEKEDITTLPQVPPNTSNAGSDTMKETIVSWPDTPSRLEALDTMPTPMGGFGSMRIPRSSNGTFASDSTGTYVSPSSIMADGLRSNPPSETERQLSRAISAPVRNSRRVLIRPSDLIISKAGHDHRLFRENIVSTPYPARQSSIGEIGNVLRDSGSTAASTEPVQEKASLKTPRRLSRSRHLSHTTERSEPDDSSKDIASTDSTTQVPVPSTTNATTTTSPSSKAPEIPLSTKPPYTPTTPAAPVPVTSKSDRFPSPSAPEILILSLHLSSSHAPSSGHVRVEIEILDADKPAFDDERLFTAIRATYISRLLGHARWWFCARTLYGASAGGGGTAEYGFDGTDFVRHLVNPRVGRRRKMWLLWLRNQQQAGLFGVGEGMGTMRRGAATAAAAARRSYLPQSSAVMGGSHIPEDEKEASSSNTASSPVFSFMGHSRQNSGQNHPLAAAMDVEASPGLLSPSVAAAATTTQPSMSLPRMPFNSSSSCAATTTTTAPSSGMAPSTPFITPTSFKRSRSLALSSAYPSYISPLPHHHHHNPVAGPPSISLHHTFSVRAIALATAAVFSLALLACVLWILFGYPGRSAAQGDGTATIITPGAGTEVLDVPWRRDAQSRVGVGLVLGVVVLLVGGAVEVGWVWGSWVLV